MKSVYSSEEQGDNYAHMDTTFTRSLARPVADSMSKKTKKTFAHAYDDLAPKLYRFCILRVSSKEVAEDLVSQAFLQTWQYLHNGKKIDSYPAFMYRVLRNLISNHMRSGYKKTILVDEALINTLVDQHNHPEEMNKSAEMKGVLRAMRALPLEQQEMLHWRYVDGLSVGDIAELSGKKRNAVYVAIFRSVKKLKDIYSGYV